MHVQGSRRGESSPGPDDAADQFRHVLSRFSSGVTAVTGTAPFGPVGLTVQSFMSLSLEPPLVVFAASRTSRAWPHIHESGSYCVNLLAASQVELAERMATRGADKFGGVGWRPSTVTGSPLLDGVVGYVDCTIEAVHEGGDHYLVVGRVVDLDLVEDVAGLTYFQGRYGSTDGA
ncbi:flavin reductase family protein [Nocardioides coralli]|uniref:flavin reductase family protein n=1 Tax=Nocardioides coralli TaxID=2872154 RepID=UPI002016D7AC|nr:flavin reductase family protein [Nocardioides coralli]